MKTIALLIGLVAFNAMSQNENQLSQSKEMEVLIYPNPAIDNCVVKVDEGSSCSLINSSGTIIGTWKVDYTNTLHLSDLKSGIFQLLIEKDTFRVIKKIVVL
jgi:hypothetical protein